MGSAVPARPAMAAAPHRTAGRVLVAAASLWWTLVWMAAAGLILAAGLALDAPVGAWLALPCFGLCVNLAAALGVNERLRRQPGLLVFHVGLAVLALLAAAGRLTALNGTVEVTQGTPFEAGHVEGRAAPLHPWRLDRVGFVQGPFSIGYDPGMLRRHTRSTVHVPVADGGWESVEIGDDRPLKMFGYRFYTSPNKGYAVVLTHIAADGASRTGAVHLPSYPLNEHRQANRWPMPGGPVVDLWLHMPEPVLDENAAWSFRLPEEATLVVEAGGARHELKPGQEVPIGAARLRYDELRAWMGYTVFYDPTLPWLAAAALVASAGLGWHAVGKIRAVSGDGDA
ncbi:MAG TPA: hypothetical protein VD995_26485 [Azospirillum sp.]|nr:hypothetical protein [Azospirillum sp.]